MNRRGTVQSRIVFLPSCKASTGAREVIWTEQAKEFQACRMEPDVCFCPLCFTHALGVLYLHRQTFTCFWCVFKSLRKSKEMLYTQLNYVKWNLIDKSGPPQARDYMGSADQLCFLPLRWCNVNVGFYWPQNTQHHKLLHVLLWQEGLF